MGYIAKNVQRSQYALGIALFMDTFERPAILGPKDLPYLPPPYASILEKTNAFVALDKVQNQAATEAGFVSRTQSGAPAWAGPPGLPETRPITVRPEQSRGTIFNWLA